MKIFQRIFHKDKGWDASVPFSKMTPQLVLAFGNRELLESESPARDLRNTYPAAQIVGCSTAGEIQGTSVLENSLVATCIQFDATRVKTAEAQVENSTQSIQAGATLARELMAPDLTHVFVLSDGLNVNGSALVEGLAENLPMRVAITGGLSGDGAQFKRTLVLHNGTAREGRIVAVGFYGNKLRVGYGSLGGWDTFGPERHITKSIGNVVYELEHFQI